MKLIGSAPSIEKLKELLDKYFYGDIKIDKLVGDYYLPYHATGKRIEGYMIINRNGRWRIERELGKG